MNLKFGRRTALVATLGWVCVVAALAITRVVDVSSAIVLLALAPLVVGLILTNRWHQTNLRRFSQLNETLAHKFEVTTKALEQVSGRLAVAEHALEEVVSKYALEPE